MNRFRLLPSLLLVILFSSCAPVTPAEPTSTATPFPTSTPNPTPTATAIPVRHVAFASRDSGTAQIYTIGTDGLNQSRVSANTMAEGTFSYSPDGQYILFEGYEESIGNSNIYRMNADGTNVVQLTSRSQNEWNPVFSPDGSKISFMSQMGTSDYDIFVMNADGTNIINLSNSTNLDVYAVWSPDSTRIAYKSSTSINEDDIFDSNNNMETFIRVVNADGSGGFRLPVPEGVTRPNYPRWSPDGSQILYSCGSTIVESPDANGLKTVNNYQGICLTNVDDSSTIKIYEVMIDIDAFKVLYYPNPTWSPDGSKIAFIGLMEDRTTEIFTMNPDGSNQVQITNDDLELKREVIWSPDSSMMLFLTYQGRALSRLYSVYSMFSDGSGTTLLTETVRFNPMPTWID